MAAREQYHERVRRGTHSRAALAATDLIATNIFVTIPEVSAYAHCTYNTAKAAVTALSNLDILTPLVDAYPATWGAYELYQEVYGDDPG